MKPLYQTVALSGVNLLALSTNTADPTALSPTFSDSTSSQQVQAMNEKDMRDREASHLEVYAGCKWGHAAFDPVQVASEVPSSEVLSLHAQITRV